MITNPYHRSRRELIDMMESRELIPFDIKKFEALVQRWIKALKFAAKRRETLRGDYISEANRAIRRIRIQYASTKQVLAHTAEEAFYSMYHSYSIRIMVDKSLAVAMQSVKELGRKLSHRGRPTP